MLGDGALIILILHQPKHLSSQARFTKVKFVVTQPSIGGWVVRVGPRRVPGVRFGVADGKRSHCLFWLPALSLYIW